MQLTQGLRRGNPNVTQPIPILFRSPIYLNHHGHHRFRHCYHNYPAINVSVIIITIDLKIPWHFKDTLCTTQMEVISHKIMR